MRYGQLEDPDIVNLTTVASFLIFLEAAHPNAIYGSRRVTDAVNSLADLFSIDRANLREQFLLQPARSGDDRRST